MKISQLPEIHVLNKAGKFFFFFFLSVVVAYLICLTMTLAADKEVIACTRYMHFIKLKSAL